MVLYNIGFVKINAEAINHQFPSFFLSIHPLLFFFIKNYIFKKLLIDKSSFTKGVPNFN